MAHVVDTSLIDSHLGKLAEMKHFSGEVLTTGLSDAVVRDFLENGYAALAVAIDQAYDNFVAYQSTHAEFLALDESEQIDRAHGGLTNFYAEDAVNPYVAAAASGPWIVSLKGAVIYDCGGYGMLGLGHAPKAILDAMSQPQVMANIMTASVSQVDFVERLNKEIGHTRSGGSPYVSYLCLNSGSEANTLASRLVDVNCRRMTDPGARFEGASVRGLTLQGSFHGRTDRPARFSDSCRDAYEKHLASYRNNDYLLTVEPNNIAALEAVFKSAEASGQFIESLGCQLGQALSLPTAGDRLLHRIINPNNLGSMPAQQGSGGTSTARQSYNPEHFSSDISRNIGFHIYSSAAQLDFNISITFSMAALRDPLIRIRSPERLLASNQSATLPGDSKQKPGAAFP